MARPADSGAGASTRTENNTKISRLLELVTSRKYDEATAFLATLGARELNEENNLLTNSLITLSKDSHEIPEQLDAINSVFSQAVEKINFDSLHDIQKAEILNHTIGHEHMEAFRLLLRMIDVNVRDNLKRDALTMAVMVGNAEAIRDIFTTRKVRGLEGRLSDFVYERFVNGAITADYLMTADYDPLVRGIPRNLRTLFSDPAAVASMLYDFLRTVESRFWYAITSQICDRLEANYGLVLPQPLLRMAFSDVGHGKYDDAMAKIARMKDASVGEDGNKSILQILTKTCEAGKVDVVNLLISKIDITKLNAVQRDEIKYCIARFTGDNPEYRGLLLPSMERVGFVDIVPIPTFGNLKSLTGAPETGAFGARLFRPEPRSEEARLAAERESARTGIPMFKPLNFGFLGSAAGAAARGGDGAAGAAAGGAGTGGATASSAYRPGAYPTHPGASRTAGDGAGKGPAAGAGKR